MKITNNSVSQSCLNPAQGMPGAAPVQRDTNVGAAAEDTDGYTPSAEWVRLVDLVKQEPAIREDRVADAAQRLQDGDYLTGTSAEKTAEAMLLAAD